MSSAQDNRTDREHVCTQTVDCYDVQRVEHAQTGSYANAYVMLVACTVTCLRLYLEVPCCM